MNYTGERPTLEHGSDGSLLRYHSILPFVKDKRVIDWACGCGIGTRYLKPYCDSIVGYDHDEEAIQEAKLLSPDIEFYTNISDIWEFEKPEIYVMNEFIEHLEKNELEELLQSLSVDICGTTPSGDYYKYHPETKEQRIGFHTWHYTYNELVNLMSKYYKFVEIYGSIKDPTIEPFLSYVFCCSEHK